jgi:hypothetical protein
MADPVSVNTVARPGAATVSCKQDLYPGIRPGIRVFLFVPGEKKFLRELILFVGGTYNEQP